MIKLYINYIIIKDKKGTKWLEINGKIMTNASGYYQNKNHP